MSSGIAAWGTYLPFWRLQRSAIKGVLGSGGGRGTRAVASHDEDTTTLGVEGARRALAVISDLRTGLAGSAEERDSGDGAAALVCAPDGAVAELIGRGAASDEFLDRWRVPGDADSHVWEERFGEELYVPLAREAFAAALKDAGLAEGDIDHAIVTGLHVRAVKAVTKGLGVRDGALAPDLIGSIGNLGAAQAAVLVCDVLERAEPGQVIMVLSLADGADAL